MTNCKTFSSELSICFKALGNEKRQQIILEVFSDCGEHNINEVAKRVNIAQSTASEHLALLKRAGILTSRKVEKEVFHKLNRKGIIAFLDNIRATLACCE
jgi:DNA-binding transcriptional ArsR family regulator